MSFSLLSKSGLIVGTVLVVGSIPRDGYAQYQQTAQSVQHAVPGRSEQSGSPTQGTGTVMDTTIRPGRQDFSLYTTPGLCLQATWSVAHVVTRTALDTAAYAPERDTMPTRAVTMARACGAQFDAQHVPANTLLDLLHLSLIAGNDAQAHAAAARYIAGVQDPVERRWALYALDTTYLHAKPMRLAAVESVTAQLDSLGPAATLQRGMAHGLLYDDARLRYDTTRLRREALATLALTPQLTPQDHGDRDARTETLPIFDLLLLQLLHSPKDAWAQTIQLVRPTGYPLDTPFLEAVPRILRLDWMSQQLGQPIPPLHVQYWRGMDSRAHRWPVPGKVSIYLRLGPSLELADAAMWGRIMRKYGSALNVTFIDKTHGYFRDGPPLTTTQEADRVATYFLDELHLPVTLALDTAQFQRLPDGRRIDGPAAYEQDPYYRSPFILADPSGKIAFMIPGVFPGGLPEGAIEAWIDHVLARGGGTIGK